MNTETKTIAGISTLQTSEPGVAQSMNLPYKVARKMADISIPLRRPKRCVPSDYDHTLQEEMSAWETASDEAWESFEGSLEE